MLDGYMTIDTGAWHFHLCVGDHRGTPSPELARLRRVARCAFFTTEGGTCAPTTWGLRLWNGRAEQIDRKSTRLNSSHGYISYAVFCLKKKKRTHTAIAT